VNLTEAVGEVVKRKRKVEIRVGGKKAIFRNAEKTLFTSFANFKYPAKVEVSSANHLVSSTALYATAMDFPEA
jgi:hypothetical protein